MSNSENPKEKKMEETETEDKKHSNLKVSFEQSSENNENNTLNSTFLDNERRGSRLFSLSRQGLIRVEFYSGGPNVEKWIARFRAGAQAEDLSSSLNWNCYLLY